MEQLIRVNDVDLCAETFGAASDPAILLIMGASAAMDWWEDDFCARLAAGGRLVIRYDHRDTGRSVSYPVGAPGYTFRDLVADAVGVLDAFDVDRGHLAGLSLGGAVAQVAALEFPERVASLTLIATSSGGREPDLPGMADRAVVAYAELSEPDWDDRAAVLDYLVGLWRPCAAVSRPLDEAHVRALAGRVLDRTVSIAATCVNHGLAERGEPWRARLGQIAAPTLVIHGAEDPIHPVEHGRALAREIRGARLLELPATGHELPPHTWDAVIPALLEHTA